MEYLEIRSPLAEARIYTQGAHVATFHPKGQREPVLFLSQKSHYQAGTPIRGGVPVIFPWFGPHAERADLPAHGLARTRKWTLREVREEPDGVVVVEWSMRDDEEMRQEWPHAFQLRYRVAIGDSLAMTLEVENRSSAPFRYEEALHTYLQVSDARAARVRGLKGTEYLDKVEGMARKTELSDRIEIERETDRIYLDTLSTCAIDDPGYGRTLEISKTGSHTTVLWNPWIGKAAALPDLGDDEWPRMICIETANAADNAVWLEPGARHEMSATVQVRALGNPSAA